MHTKDAGGQIRPILTDEEPSLRRPSAEVRLGDTMLRNEIADLATTLNDFRSRAGFGRAISAPQVGIQKRLIVMNLGAGAIPLVNPTVTARSVSKQRVWDDCLSVPDKLVLVERHCQISVQYQTPGGDEVTWHDLAPDLSELLQHEIDHLDGILMTDRVIDDAIRPLDEREQLTGPSQPLPRLQACAISARSDQINPIFTNSPQYHCTALSDELGCEVVLKVETLNPIGCFKGRGASVLIREHVVANGADASVITASAGNWGQAVAYACREQSTPCTVYAPHSANPVKLDHMRRLGANVVLTDGVFDDAKQMAKREAKDLGATFAEDGEDLSVTEGHGSIAIELFEQPDLTHLDAILVPVGNGALIAGIACWTKAASPATQVIGVAAAGAPAMHSAWSNPTSPEQWSTANVVTIADGLAVRDPIPSAIDDMTATVDDFLLVGEDDIVRAMSLLHQRAHIVTEPAGASAIAGLVANPARFAGMHVAAVLSGGNLDPSHREFLDAKTGDDDSV